MSVKGQRERGMKEKCDQFGRITTEHCLNLNFTKTIKQIASKNYDSLNIKMEFAKLIVKQNKTNKNNGLGPLLEK